MTLHPVVHTSCMRKKTIRNNNNKIITKKIKKRGKGRGSGGKDQECSPVTSQKKRKKKEENNTTTNVFLLELLTTELALYGQHTTGDRPRACATYRWPLLVCPCGHITAHIRTLYNYGLWTGHPFKRPKRSYYPLTTTTHHNISCPFSTPNPYLLIYLVFIISAFIYYWPKKQRGANAQTTPTQVQSYKKHVGYVC